MIENPFNKPSPKEKQESNLLSFAEAKKQIENGNAAHLAKKFEKLSHLSPNQQFEIMKLINELDLLIDTLEELNNLSEKDKIEVLQEIASAEYGFLLIYFFEQLDLSSDQQFEIVKLIIRRGGAWKLTENFGQLFHSPLKQQFKIAKLIAQDFFGAEGLIDNFEKLSHLSSKQQFEIAKLIIRKGKARILVKNFEKLSYVSPEQQFEIAKLIAQNGMIEGLAMNFEKLSHLSPDKQFKIAELIVQNGATEELARNFEKLFHLPLEQQFEIAKLIIWNYGVEELARNFEKLSHLSSDQQFKIVELINKLELPIDTLEELNSLPEKDRLEILKEIISADFGFLLIYFFKELNLSSDKQFKIVELIIQKHGIVVLVENFEKLSHLPPAQQFEITKLIAQKGGVLELAKNFEKLSQLKAISSEDKKNYMLFLKMLALIK